MTLFLCHSHIGYTPYSLLPSPEEIQTVSNEEIEKSFYSLNVSDRTNYLVTVIRCANKLIQCAPDRQEKALSLAKKVSELIKSGETRVEKNHFYGPPQVTVENRLLKNVVFELTMHSSKEAYELFEYPSFIVQNANEKC